MVHSQKHKEHIRLGIFKKGCNECEEFVAKYLLTGRPKKIIEFR